MLAATSLRAMQAYAIATPERTATRAGVAAFEAGGNALDAALAAAVALAVSYPHNCGVGGDLIALVRAPGGRMTSINASGPAPRRADAAALRARGPRMPVRGVEPITVPGAVAGWEQLHRAGARLPWAAAFDAAVGLAQDGVPVARSLAAAMTEERADIDADPGLRAVLPAGLAEGDVLRQPALAATLRALAAGGAAALYGGPVGRALVAGLASRGAWLGEDDLAAFAPELGAPLRGRFRDLEILTSPPNSSGVLLLQALAALEASGIEDPLGRDAARLAALLREGGRQRHAELADPRMAPVDVAGWLGPERIAELARGAPPAGRAPAPAPRPGGDTIAIVAADASGRAVSLIQSLFHAFGACVLEPRTGILLHDRGAFFSLAAGHPNELAPGKRPAHTLMPVLLERAGRPAGVLGTMGGHAHAQFHVQVLLRLLAGSPAPAAVAAPRWVIGTDDDVAVEADADPGAVASLRAAGMDVAWVPPRDEELGHVQAIWVGEDGGFDAGSDPRADGSAVVSSDGRGGAGAADGVH